MCCWLHWLLWCSQCSHDSITNVPPRLILANITEDVHRTPWPEPSTRAEQCLHRCCTLLTPGIIIITSVCPCHVCCCVAVAAVALLIFTAVERWYQHQSLENRNDGNGLALRENIKLKGLLYSLLWTVVHFCILLIDIFTCKASEFFTPNTNSQNVHF